MALPQLFVVASRNETCVRWLLAEHKSRGPVGSSQSARSQYGGRDQDPPETARRRSRGADRGIFPDRRRVLCRQVTKNEMPDQAGLSLAGEGLVTPDLRPRALPSAARTAQALGPWVSNAGVGREMAD